jgi:hypothetical protein
MSCRSLVLAYCIWSAVHVVLRCRNLTMHCPAKSGLIGVANNYVHCWRFFTSQLSRHNCVIIFESASATLIVTNWSTRGSSVIPLRITWLTTMFTYFAGRCFASASRHDLGTGTCFVQTCIITAAKGEPLTVMSFYNGGDIRSGAL